MTLDLQRRLKPSNGSVEDRLDDQEVPMTLDLQRRLKQIHFGRLLIRHHVPMTLDLQRRLKHSDGFAMPKNAYALSGSNDIRSPKEIETLQKDSDR